MFPMLRDALGEGTQKWIADRCGERPLAVSRWKDAGSSQAQPHPEVQEMLERLRNQADRRTQAQVRDPLCGAYIVRSAFLVVEERPACTACRPTIEDAHPLPRWRLKRLFFIHL